MADRACRLCSARLTETVADLGMSPLSNAFISLAAADRMEPFYPLHAYVCGACWPVQLQEFERPRQLLHHQAHGAEPDPIGSREGLAPPQAQDRRVGR
jgi:hypothetical protein